MKFMKSKEAVSPVIAVILMVAITVVLAATVYVWVSGFSGQGKQAANMSCSRISSTAGGNFTVVSADSGLNWNGFVITFTGAAAGTAPTGTIDAGDMIPYTAASGTACTITIKQTSTNTLVYQNSWTQ
ncbi:MAG: type IV pilin [Candidatus Thermoplasmatota archaeon]|nr:type IV pilin [Candidatus Thermoplasmatota archaeon]